MRAFATLMCAAALAAAPPFWETKSPSEWSDTELNAFLTNSPWAQQAIAGKSNSGAQVYLATAQPVREAEAERDKRAVAKHRVPAVEDTGSGEYADFMQANEGKVIVLAVAMRDGRMLGDAAEVKRLEQSCVLRAGKQKYRMTGHFPPSPGDPWLRLVFPRGSIAGVATLHFEIYVPGLNEPYRFAEFKTTSLTYKGSLEF